MKLSSSIRAFAQGLFGSLLLTTAIAVQGLAGSQPANEYLRVVQHYADTMLVHGRDCYGTVASPLFAAALDRTTLKLQDNPPPPIGVRPQDRILTGANPMHDQNLYRLLYTLSSVTGEKRYGAAADEALRFFLTNCPSAPTGLLPWGEHLGWDFRKEQVTGNDIHEFYRPWLLWERSFALAPSSCQRFAKGLWEHQIFDHKTGNFSRHARFSRHGPQYDFEFSRHAGFYIATWSAAYSSSKDEQFLQAIETLLQAFESRRRSDGGFPASSHQPGQTWWEADLSWAVDVWQSATQLPEPLKTKLRAAADRTDLGFLHAKKNLASNKNDFWKAVYAKSVPADSAMVCLERFRQTGKKKFRDLFLECAELYLMKDPPSDQILFPGTFGTVIALEAAAFEETRMARYRDKADELAVTAVKMFWNGQALPRASSQDDHYEAVTRGDSLALALLDLWHLHQHGHSLKLGWVDR